MCANCRHEAAVTQRRAHADREHQLRALRRQREREGTADALGCAGQDDAAARECAHVHPFG